LCFILTGIMLDHQAVYHRLHSVDFVAVHHDVFIQRGHHPIYPGAHKTSLANFLKDSLVCPLTAAHQRRQHQQASPIG